MQVTPRLAQVERHPENVGCPGSVWLDVERIVVLRDDRLGDLVLTLPAVDALRRTYPEARLGLMVAPTLTPLARMVDGVDEVLESSRDPAALRRNLASFAPDLAVCVTRHARGAWAATRARVAHRVGTGRRVYSQLFERRVAESRSLGERHEVEYALSFAHASGAPGGAVRFPLSVPDPARQAAREWLAAAGIGEPFVVIHPGSGGSCPRWPLAHFVSLAAGLRDAGRRVVVSIGPEDSEERHRFETTPQVAALPRLEGGLPILAALLSTASLVISNSTGPLHLAAALDRPTLALHAPWASCGISRWGPYNAQGWGVVADVPGADAWSRRRRLRVADELMGGISPFRVLECSERMLAGRAPSLD